MTQALYAHMNNKKKRKKNYILLKKKITLSICKVTTAVLHGVNESINFSFFFCGTGV
jgi:hypothetical protein